MLLRWATPLAGRYSSLQKTVHWLVVALLAAQVATSGAIERSHAAHHEGRTPDPWDLLLHEMHTLVGLAVFCLVALRILLRILGRTLPGSAGQPRTLRIAAATNHYLLYGTLLALPISGMAARYLDFLVYGPVHVILTRLLMVLVAVHVAAALWHIVFLRDGVIERILPRPR